ncbi:LOW QUALITY PROTEIN: calcium homeostasis modulator protein 3 [Scleropages formosus]|uniref:LOW QUALITY PROTEIN: calcium homeostasis modulator protein 3 n=1 Tax=Scleropages formosus TaxID=113540 RepID=UPI0010FA6930|nr:LOW QUALITY PROTEIN: calcium homeostasis modulator protein 3 [Scleropages formosus]
MDRLKLVLQYFQSNSESISNGICVLLALISVKLYTSFDFNCPCIPQYNKVYALGVMFVPPVILFFLGVMINRHTGVMMEEWLRPVGKRSKNPAVVKYLFSAMLQRALLAPMVWVLVTLLDGKCFVCAFSMSVDPRHFTGLPNNTGLDLVRIMAKVPCKEDAVFQNSTFRKAVSRYVRCYSQAIGWSILLLLILLGALARVLKPCFDHATFLQTRYWSNYLDIEQKLFDETCVLHARDFARKCVEQFFEGMQEDVHLRLPLAPARTRAPRTEADEETEDRLHGITRQEQVNRLLHTWYECRPELDVSRGPAAPGLCHMGGPRRPRALLRRVALPSRSPPHPE